MPGYFPDASLTRGTSDRVNPCRTRQFLPIR